jgi:outer membrane protein assembly factor BamE (lipoprotein component of BamABCDE complex)
MILKKTSTFIVFLSLALVSGCSTTKHTHGQILTQERISYLKEGVHRKDDVLQLLGSPSTIDPFDKHTWIYTSSARLEGAFQKNQMLDRQTLKLTFTEDGTLKSVIERSMDDARELVPSKEVTRTQGQSMGIVEQFSNTVGLGDL